MEKEITLEFGKKYRVGNFIVFKHNRVLRRSEVEQLRNQMGIPEDLRKHLQRAQLPYIKVEALSGIWAVQFCCNTNMYMFIDHVLAQAIKADEEGIVPEHNSLTDFAHFFTMFFTDTTVLGDSIYTADKANALKAYMERNKAFAGAQETQDEKAADDAILEEVKKDEEAKATIIDMANAVKKGGKG
jgi:hypothetical protein